MSQAEPISTPASPQEQPDDAPSIPALIIRLRTSLTITHEEELDGLKEIGRIVANTMHRMARATEPGMTTRERDAIGRALLDLGGQCLRLKRFMTFRVPPASV